MSAVAFAPERRTLAADTARVLCVDDEPRVLEGLRDNLRRSFDVRVAESGADALALLERDPDGYAVVISDMRMPGMSGATFLAQARRVAPNAVRPCSPGTPTSTPRSRRSTTASSSAS
jgi:response regulator RpfG family c-di-GMP phosphodiesterase